MKRGVQMEQVAALQTNVQTQTIHIELGSNIRIPDWSDVRKRFPALSKQIRADVTIPNPEYIEAKRLGRYTGNIRRHIICYEFKNNTLILPIGYIKRLQEHAEKAGADLIVSDQRALRLAPKVQSKITLRKYQEPVIPAMLEALETHGVAHLVSPAGSGKTEMALEIAARLGQATLWNTHTNDLAEQVRQRAIDRLGLDPTEIGMIGSGKKTIGKFLTIGLVQTLSQMDLTGLAYRFGTVILDECHHSPASTWTAVLNNLAPRYKFGVTATLERNDGLETITRLYLGPTAFRLNRADVATGLAPTRLHKVTTDCVPEAWTKYQEREEKYNESLTLFRDQKIRSMPKKPHLPYNAILQELLEDEKRNQLIVDHIAKHAPGRHSLVLSARVSHCELLAELLAKRLPKLNVAVIHGKQSMTVRKSILDKVRNGQIHILLSVDIAKEGLDAPILDQLFLVAGGRDKIVIPQAVGRIQRIHPGKTDAIIHDFVDEKVGVFRAQYWQRYRMYKELGIVGKRRSA